MDVLRVRDLTRLTDQRGGTRISMFLPISHRGSQPGCHRVRLTNLLRHARDALRVSMCWWWARQRRKPSAGAKVPPAASMHQHEGQER